MRRMGKEIENPCLYESRRKLAKTTPNTISNEELKNAYLHSHGVARVMLGLLCCTGIRLQELLDIKWEDINFEEGYISINKQFHMQDGLAKLTPLKTKNAKRKVFMNSDLTQFLLERRKEFQEHEIKFAAQRRQNEIMIENTDGEMISSLLLVNTLPNGKYQTEWAIKHHMRPIKQKYGIHFKFHNLRHTYGTSLAMMNTPEHILLNHL